jgi:large repetitive protein
MKIHCHFIFICLLAISPLHTAFGQLQIESVTSQDADCYGEASGSITIEISGGTAPYYYWYGSPEGSDQVSGVPITSHTFTNVNAGDYFVRVIDALGIRVNSEIIVGEPAELMSFVYPDPAGICPLTDLQFSGNPAGGNGGYMHEWTGSGASFLDNRYIEDPVFNSGIPGNYDLTYRVTDQKGCESQQVVLVGVYQTISANFDYEDVTCFNGINGSIVVTGQEGGSGSYEYRVTGRDWQLSNVFGSLAAGIYDIWVRDALYPDACQVITGTVEIGEPAILTASVSHTDADCHGEAGGSITISGATGGSGSFQYRISGFDWQPGGFFDGIAAGTYVVEIRDASDTDCIIELNGAYTVSQPDALNADIDHTDVSCFGGNNGTITISNPSGGSGNYWYRITGTGWRANGFFQGLSAGNYEIRIRNVGDPGCITVLDAAYTVSQPAASLGISVVSQIDVLCHGENTGSVTVEGSGGTGPYRYSLDGGTTLQEPGTFSSLAAGNYTVIVVDANDCSTGVPVTIAQPATAVGGSVVSQTDVLCFGESTGSVTVEGSGGTGPYLYSLDGGTTLQGSGTFLSLAAGSYTVTVVDATGCSSTGAEVTIAQPATAVGGSVVSQTDVLCHGESTGSVTVEGSGGTGPYRYSLDGGTTLQESGIFLSLAAGSYTVTVVDATGCSSTGAEVTIAQPATAVGGSLVSQTDVLCHGESTGSVTVEGSGGTGPYRYSLDGGTTLQGSGTFLSLAAGSYTVTVVDATGCSSTGVPVTIAQPATAVGGSLVSQTDVLCHGESTGSVTVEGSGGTGPYRYSLDGGTTLQESGTFLSLAAGSYTVTVVDATGCSSSEVPVTIFQPGSAVEGSITGQTDVLCFGESTGSVSVEGSGGTGPYLYSLDGGTTLQGSGTFLSLAAGSYTVTVVDAVGCGTDVMVSVSGPGMLSADIVSTDITCAGFTDGSISLSGMQGGTMGNYEFSINGVDWFNDPLFENLGIGSYTVWLRDADMPGCYAEAEESPAVISGPDPVVMTTEIIHVQCYGENTGSIEVTAGGGNGGFQYRLDDGTWQTGPVFGGLTAGNYLVQARDAQGCQVNEPVTLNEPYELIFDEIQKNDESCFEAGDGNIEIFVSGGIPPYRYSVDGGTTFQAGSYFGDLQPGIYQAVVEDALFCPVSLPEGILLEAAAEIVIDNYLVSNATCNGAEDGEISVEASGGEGIIEYSIDGVDWQGSGIFSDLGAGVYTVRIRDAKGCFITGNFTVTEPEALIINASHENIDCYGAGNGTIYVSALGGVPPLTYRLFLAGSEIDVLISPDPVMFSSLAPGTYRVEVTEEGGCFTAQTDDIVLEEPDELTALVDHTNIRCAGDTNGIITIEASGGTGNFEYSINNGVDFHASGGIFSNLSQGTYDIIVKDGTGCLTSPAQQVTITDPPQIQLQDTLITDATCYGALDGSIQAFATGGTGTLRYALDNDGYQPAGLFSGLAAGPYTLYVKDENNCVSTYEIDRVGQPDILAVSALVTGVACHDDAGDLQILAAASGGTAPYTVSLYLAGMEQESINGVAQNDTVTFGPLTANRTDYMVMVEDAGSCLPVNSGLLSTVFPEEFLLDYFLPTDLTCFGINEGKIEILAAGGTAPFNYSLYDESDELISILAADGAAVFDQLPAGNFRVAITDANGCGPLTVENIIISGPQEIIIGNLTGSELKCYGDSDGVINIIATGGTGSLEYSINGGVDFYASGSFVGLSPGTYEVRVRDGSACVLDAGIYEIISPPELLFDFVNVTDITIGSQNETGSIEIGMSGGTAPYSYSTGNGAGWQEGNLFDGLDEGEYGILVTDANGCMADTTVYVERITGIIASVNTQMPSCNGSADGVIIIAADFGTEPYRYSIDDGVSYHLSGIFSGVPAGEYQVVVTDAGNHVYRQTALLTEPDPVVVSDSVIPAWCSRFNPDGTVNPDGAITLSVSGGAGSYSYLWSSGAVTKDVGQLAAGDYSVTITDANNCGITHAVRVGYVNSIEVSLGEPPVICPGTGILLEPVVQTDAQSVLYSWTASHGPDPQPVASPVVSPAVPALYMLSVTDENNCFDEAQVFVDLHPLQGISIGNDTTVLQGSAIELEAKGGDFISYQWAPSTGLSTVSGPVTSAVVMNSTQYFVRAETAQGCEEYAYITINVLSPVVPVSGFTPNGDGVNDMFDITNAGDYPDIVVEVFNRAGQRVFHSRGYSDDRRWDGTYNGRDLPVGTYYFVITLNDGVGTRPVTGPVTIIR